MFSTVASLKVQYILMHTRGTPLTMQLPENTCYNDIINDLATYFESKLNQLERLGLNNVWLDPGFGFAKTVDQNYEILLRLPELIHRFPNNPMLVALSNKSMITKRLSLLNLPSGKDSPLPDSELGTLALNSLAIRDGASLLRVHSPRLSRLAIQLLFPQS